jgi:hypothetical protein
MKIMSYLFSSSSGEENTFARGSSVPLSSFVAPPHCVRRCGESLRYRGATSSAGISVGDGVVGTRWSGLVVCTRTLRYA